MIPSSQERDLLTRYLLGYLSDPDREAVSDRLFTEDSLAEALEEIERDLLDDYAAGNLSARDRTAVATRLLTSERQQEKLTFARTFAGRSRAPKRRNVQRLLLWAAAAILTVGAAGIWWSASSRPTEPQSAQKAPPVETPAPKSPSPAPVAVFAALLTPGSLRDGEMQEVVLPPGAELVRLDLQLTGNPPAVPYTARLTRQRETLLEQGGLSAHTEANTPVLSVVLRSSLLTAGTYRLYLTTSGPQPESVSYYFRIR